MLKIKELWFKLMILLKDKNIIFSSPLIIFALAFIIYKSFLMILAMAFWMLVITANVDEKT
jgi:hypothetical protein